MSTPILLHAQLWVVRQRVFTHLLDGFNLHLEFVVFVPCRALLFLVRALLSSCNTNA